MLVVHVDVHVRPEGVEAFQQATLTNAQASLGEPGVMRFDVLQDQTEPTHFVLVEVYRDADAALGHKETAHYAVWRDAVSPLMARSRQSQKYDSVFPPEAGWETAAF